MTHALTPCDQCHRHIRASEGACPFCATARSGATVRLVAAAAVGAALAGLAGDAQAQPLPPRITMDHGPAQGYGAPPHHPFPGLDPVERPAPAPVVAPAARVAATVAVAVSGTDARTAASLRSAVRRGLDAIRACGERAGGARGREARRSVMVGWGAASPAPRDALARCIAAAVRAALPEAVAGQRARIAVQVHYTEAGAAASIPEPGCERRTCRAGTACRRGRCLRIGSMDPVTREMVCTPEDPTCGGSVALPLSGLDGM